MKYLVLLLVIGIVAWLMFARHARPVERRKPPTAIGAEEMVECVHCRLNLPRSDAVFDGADPYCSEAHRLAGPRGR